MTFAGGDVHAGKGVMILAVVFFFFWQGVIFVPCNAQLSGLFVLLSLLDV